MSEAHRELGIVLLPVRVENIKGHQKNKVFKSITSVV